MLYNTIDHKNDIVKGHIVLRSILKVLFSIQSSEHIEHLLNIPLIYRLNVSSLLNKVLYRAS